MRLVRFGEKEKEKPGIWNKGKIIDLREIFPEIPDIGEEFFAHGWLEKAAQVENEGTIKKVRLGSPVSRPSKIICLGKNYAEHAKEGGFEKPDQPLIFSKSSNSLNGPFDDVLLPLSSHKVDWEVELAVIIGKRGKRIKKESAMEHIAGFSVMNDVSARDVQFSDAQWFRGKSFDSFAPLGPTIVTTDEVIKEGGVESLNLTSLVNGVIMQEGQVSDMIFDIPYILEYISKDITLFPGDIISTGTPSGVGIFRDPPIVLAHGDVVECRIDTIGAVKNRFVSIKEDDF